MSRSFRLAALLVGLLLSGCASVSIQRNLDETSSFAKQRFGTELRLLDSDDARRQAQSEVDAALKKPLTQEDATRLALAYSPAFQVLIAETARSSARTTQAARLPNPIFTFEKLVRMEHGMREVEIGRMIAFSVIDLLHLPT